MSYPSSLPEEFKPLSVREAAALIGMSSQHLGSCIRNGEVPAHSLNGHDYVLWRNDVLEFDRKRRHAAGKPSRAEIEQRRPPGYNNQRVLDRQRG